MKRIEIKRLKINWVWVFWVGVIILFLWFFAKDIGLINTPILLQAIPYFTGFGVLLALARETGKYTTILRHAVADIKEMKTELKGIRDVELRDIKLQLAHLDRRVAVVEAKI